MHSSWAFAFGGYLLVSADRTLIEDRRPKLEEACYRALLRRNVIEMHAAVLYRTAILAEVGGFSTALQACEDHDVYLRIARKYALGCYDKVVAQYRRHVSNMSTDKGRMLVNVLAVLRAQKPYVQGSTEDIRALRDGMTFYKNRYGKRLIYEALRHATKPEQWRNARQRFRLVLQLAPRAFPVTALDAIKTAALAIEGRLPMPIRRCLRRIACRKPPVPPVGQQPAPGAAH
jgi:hypothetical protein